MTKLKDPGSAITHFIGLLLAIFASVPLLVKAFYESGNLYRVSMGVYALSLIGLYAASTTFHALDLSSRANKILQKWDHMMIYLLIAGTYTPVCLLVLKGPAGLTLLAVIWGIAVIGMGFSVFWIDCPKWISSLLYIGMGWACVFSITRLFRSLSPAAFGWLLSGGILYTIGGVIYALKLSLFNTRHPAFGSHEIFHLFVMAGSICHYILMMAYLLP